MKLCYVMGRLQRGGQFYVLLKEATLGFRRGLDVSVAALEASEKALRELESNGIRDIRVGSSELLRAIAEADIVHVHDGFKVFLYARFRCKRLDEIFSAKPVVVTFHGIPAIIMLPTRKWVTYLAFESLYYRLIRRYANVVIAISKFVASQLMRKGINAVVVYNGVDLPERLTYNHRLESSLKLLYTGSCALHKSVDELVKLFVRYYKRLTEELGFNVSLTIAGFNVDKLARRYRNAENLRILASLPRDNLVRLYLEHDVYVTPSRWEGFGMGVLEALAHGLPAIVRDIPVMRELHGSCPAVKFVKSFDDYSQFKTALRDIINNYDFYSRAAIEHARKFSWDNHMEKLIRIYEHLLHEDQKRL